MTNSAGLARMPLGQDIYFGEIFFWGEPLFSSVKMPWNARRCYPGPWIQCCGCNALESKVLDFGHWIRVPGSMALDPCNPCVGCQGLGSNGLGPSVGSKALGSNALETMAHPVLKYPCVCGVPGPWTQRPWSKRWIQGPGWIQALDPREPNALESMALESRALDPVHWIQRPEIQGRLQGLGSTALGSEALEPV